MNHINRSEAVLSLAIRIATRGYESASGPLIRQRVESSLSTALAMCKEDPQEMYKLIDKER